MQEKPEKIKKADLLDTLKRRYEIDIDVDQKDIEAAMEDQLFHEGENQWDDEVKLNRERQHRPCLTVNKMPTYVSQISGDIRQNKPAIKVRPIDSDADVKIAEIMDGLICNIELQSKAGRIYSNAGESAIICGRGHWRVLVDYINDDVFEREIAIKPINNALSVTWDNAATKADRSDARWCTLTECIDVDVYERQYPGEPIVDVDNPRPEDLEWVKGEKVRVAEQYYYKTGPKKTLYMVKETDMLTYSTEYKVVEEVKEGQEVMDKREVQPKILCWVKFSGASILEGPIEQKGKYIPVCSVYGKETFIAGERRTRGIIRHAKDPQKMYNYFRSTHAERMSLEPKAPYLIGQSQIEGYQEPWTRSQTENVPYLPYDDSKNPNPPQRQFPEPMGQGAHQEIMLADQEMHDTTGLHQASLGQKSNERSGKAIMARQREGDVSSFTFIDNLSCAIEYCGKILVDLIPKVYDTERVVRLIGEDGKESFTPINASGQMFPPEYQGPRTEKSDSDGIFNNLNLGKYDLTVTVGPGYTTKRIEAADSMLLFMQQVPQMGQFIADLVAKNMDWPGAGEIERRLKKVLPPGILESEEGSPPPPAPEPDPLQQIEVVKQQQIAEQEAIKTAQEKIKLQILQAEAQLKQEKVQTEDIKQKETLAKIEHDYLKGGKDEGS